MRRAPSSDQADEQRWFVPYYVKGLALGIPIYLVSIHLWTWLLFVPSSLSKTGYDFRQAYAAAYMVSMGQSHELYSYDAQTKVQDTLISRTGLALPFVSPAYEALLLSPLAALSFRQAYFAFVLVNITALAVTYLVLRPWLSNVHAVFRWLPGAIFLGFLPAAAALIEGQDSLILTMLLASAFACLSKNRSCQAGFVTGLGFFKFPIVLPIALLFGIWRKWSFSAGFAIASAAVISLSVALTGIAQTKLYIESLLEIAGLKPPTTGLALYPVNWRMMANLHGLTVGFVDGTISTRAVHLLTVGLSLALFVWVAMSGRRATDSSALLLAIVCSVLVGHHTYLHDLSVLLIPVVILLDGFLPAEAGPDRRAKWIGRCAALMFVAPVLESYSPGNLFLAGIPVILLLVAIMRANASYPLHPVPW
jgi:Glycosyltransferase family 87